MPDPPFDATRIAESHAALTSVMAGFAFAALFLLIEQTRSAKTAAIKARYRKAMLLLFVSSVTGTLASFLFSMVTGDPPVRAFYLFAMPSGVFAINTMVLLLGLNLIFNTFGAHEASRLTRRISYVTVLFVIAATWDTVVAIVRYFAPAGAVITLITLVAYIPPLTVMLLLLLGQRSTRSWVEDNSFATYCYVVFGATLLLAGIHVANSKTPDNLLTLAPWIPLVLVAATSTIGAWTMLIFPHESAE
jgi:hypothetical protein